jgi:uncharacterized membrane protein
MSQWLAPVGLIVLAIVPMLGGVTRLSELATGAEITAQNERFFDSPIPVIIHIVAASLYFVLGAFQFVPSLRARGGYHRIAGRVLAPAGLLTALTGLWMTVFYDSPNDDIGLLITLRLVFGVAMTVSIVLGIRFIMRGDVRRHGAWMTRGYAIGIAAGTQVLTTLPWVLLVGEPDRLTTAVLLGAGWVINVIVAEIVIWRRASGPRRSGRPSRPATPVATPVAARDALV